jgi:hypothetical protein
VTKKEFLKILNSSSIADINVVHQTTHEGVEPSMSIIITLEDGSEYWFTQWIRLKVEMEPLVVDQDVNGDLERICLL